MLFWVGVAVLLGMWLWRSLAGKADYWTKRGFSTVGPGVLPHPLLSMLRPKTIRELDRSVYRHIKEELRQPSGGTSFFGQPVLFVTDLELAKLVLVKDADTFLARAQLPSMKDTDPLLYNMLSFMGGQPWKDLRAKMSPTFTTGKIKRMFHLFESSSQKLVEYLEAETRKSASGEAELVGACGRLTMDTIASVAFGLDARTFSEEESHFIQMGKKLQLEANPKLILIVILMVLAPKVAAALKIGLLDKEMESFFTQVILDAIKHRETTGERREDFLQLMLDARNGQLKDEDREEGVESSGFVLSDEVLISQSVLFILAGYDTTQSLLVFVFYELALNPDIQEELRTELTACWVRDAGRFTYESVNQHELLDKVVNETLRKYPPAPRLDRVSTADYRIPDTDLIIPNRVQVVIPTYSIHWDEEHFPEPDKFDPERFSPEVKNARHAYAFQPFGYGPRNCIGMRFALTNAKMAIASLLRNFRFEPCENTPIPVEFESTTFLKPKGGMRLKVIKI